MKRLWRAIPAVSRLVSLALLLGVTGAWVRSYVAADAVSFVRDDLTPRTWTRRSYAVYSGRGGVRFSYSRFVHLGPPAPGAAITPDVAAMRGWKWTSAAHATYPWLYDEPSPPWSQLGFDMDGLEASWLFATEFFEPSVTVPYPFLVALAAILPAQHLIARRRRRAAAAGLCGRCGYDLRASAGRCPECGEASGENVATVPEAA